MLSARQSPRFSTGLGNRTKKEKQTSLRVTNKEVNPEVMLILFTMVRFGEFVWINSTHNIVTAQVIYNGGLVVKN